MGLLFKKYSLVVDKNYDTTTSIFRDKLDDMSKKGYSLGGSTVIYNADHKSKYFSGEYKNNAFVVRQTDRANDDFYYRLLPKHEISFEALGDKTRINVKSKSTFGVVISIVFLLVSVLVFLITYECALFDGCSKLYMLFALIPLAILGIALALINNGINDTKATLEYIYSK